MVTGMREMKDSGVEWMKKIPLSWKTIRFRYLHTSSNVGDSVDKSQYSNDEEGHVFYMAGKEPITTSYERFPAWKYTNHNDLLMARNGTPYVYLPVENAVYSDHVIRVDIKKGYDRRYVRYCLQQSIEAEVVETVSIPTWSISLWDEQNIPVPPFHEQCHVADFLDSKCAEIDDLFADIQSEIETLEAYKRSVITEAVTKGLDKNAPMKDSGVPWIGEIPKGWTINRVKYLFDSGKGLSITKDNLVDEGLPVISYGQIHSKSNTGVSIAPELLRFVDLSYQKRFPQCYIGKYDFVFADTSEDYDGCGNCAYKRDDSVLFGGYHAVILHAKTKRDNRYLAYLFKTDEWRKQIRTVVSGVKVFSITQRVIMDASVILPSFEEQQKISNYLDDKCAEIDAIIAQRQEQLAVLADYKKSIIYEYVTGKKEVPVA